MKGDHLGKSYKQILKGSCRRKLRREILYVELYQQIIQENHAAVIQRNYVWAFYKESV